MLKSYCKRHDEKEPSDWNFDTEGLWQCPNCTHKMKPMVITKEMMALVGKLNNRFKDKK